MLTVRLIPAGQSDGHAACRRLREAVFVDEQGIDRSIELDDRDADCTHVLIESDGTAVGTGRMLPEGRIGRMAVAAEYRRRGLGNVLLRGLEAAASGHGLHRVSLHAQQSALGFYENAGYRRCGEDFIEAGILHTPMEREIAGNAQDVEAVLQALQIELQNLTPA